VSLSQPNVVLFDGTCNFCDGAVHFVVDHERGAELKFAALQSDAGEKLLVDALGEERARAIRSGTDGSGDPDGVVFLEDGKAYTHSTAALRVARHLRAPWRWFRFLWIVPRPLRDVVYRWFARNRYRWFGKSETCRVPTPELRARFLS
jgi:predicted DCC family thiol-disulfide oxidoreductase YuxK